MEGLASDIEVFLSKRQRAALGGGAPLEHFSCLVETGFQILVKGRFVGFMPHGASAWRRTLRVCWRRIQRAQNGGLKRWQMIAHGLPYDRQFDAFVLMAQPVTNAPDVLPGQTRTARFRFAAEPDCGLADNEQLALDSRDGLGIFAERLEIHARCELLDQADSFSNILK